MRAPVRAVFGVCLAVAIALTAAGALGLFDQMEWWTQDVRFRHARPTPTQLSDQVRLVAIDDRALDTIGRWPWNRDTLALALDEIARAGARTLATDVLFTDPQGSRLDADASTFDRALAESLGRVPTVMAAHMDEGRLLGEAWQGTEGRKVLSDLTAVIVKDVTAEASGVAARAGLGGPRLSSFLARPSAFKKYALWSTLISLRARGTSPQGFAEFRALVTGGDRTLGQFAEELLVSEAYDRDRAFGALSRFMLAGVSDGSPLDAPPIAVLAAHAGAIGFVNSQPDRDGQYRRVRPLWPTPYGKMLQMGVASALLQQRQPAAEVIVQDDAIVMPSGARLPMVDGMIYVDWPTTMFEPVGAAGYEPTNKSTGVVAIGRLVDLARARERLRSNEDRYRALMKDIAALQGLGDEALAEVPATAAVRAKVTEQGEFLLGDLASDDPRQLEGLDAEQLRIAGVYREWWRLDKAMVPARDLVRRAETELRSELEGRLVFVGFMATGVMADMINTVYGARTPGVYFHAAIASMVLEGRAIVFPPTWVGWVAAGVLALATSLLASRLGALASTSIVVAILAAYIGLAGVWAFASRGVMMPLALPVAAGVLVQVAGLGTAAFVNQRERARITRQFRARVSSQLVDRLVQNPNAISVRGEQRVATILFGDLAGFTTISEKLGSEAVVATLNLYMGALAKELSDKRAYVNKFLGDGVLAFWSAFGGEPQQCELALRACLECQRQVTEIGKRPDRAGLPRVSLRLGVATGVVTIGDCGAPPDLNDYTVIGDAANLAARLESANKQFGTAVLMDGVTFAGVDHPDELPILSLGKVVVVGQSVPVDLYTLILDEVPAGWKEKAERAIQAFGRGDFDASKAAWDDFEASFGAGKLSAPFREAMADASDARDGVLRLRAK